MIDLTGCIAIPLLKKSAFTGSYKGMRYRLKKETAPCGDQEDENDEKKEQEVIRAVIWPEPFSFASTPDEKKEQADFPFDKEGRQKAIQWLNEKYEEGTRLNYY